MDIVEVEGFCVEGLCVRTCNADETHPERARIGALWADFEAQRGPHMAQGAPAYGVYHRYASDMDGAYDVLVGCDALTRHAAMDARPWCVVNIQAGPYAVFRAHGTLPQAVIGAWSRVWAYFADPQSLHQRAYTTDFERYGPGGEVDIFIALVTL